MGYIRGNSFFQRFFCQVDMKFLKTIGCLVLSGFISSVALADTHSSTLEKLYVDSGLELLINSLPVSVRQSIESDKTTIAPDESVPEEYWQYLLEKVDVDFSADGMKRVIMEDLKDGLTEEEISKNIEWLSTPLGKKTKRISETVYSTEGAEDLDKCIADLETSSDADINPNAQQRVQQVKTLDELLQSTEVGLELIKTMQVAIATAGNLSLPSQLHLPIEEIAEPFDLFIDTIRKQLKAYTLSSYICIFDSLSNTEMDNYITELETPHATSFYKAMVKGLRQAFFNSSFAFGESVVKMSKQLEDHQEI